MGVAAQGSSHGTDHDYLAVFELLTQRLAEGGAIFTVQDALYHLRERTSPRSDFGFEAIGHRVQ